MARAGNIALPTGLAARLRDPLQSEKEQAVAAPWLVILLPDQPHLQQLLFWFRSDCSLDDCCCRCKCQRCRAGRVNSSEIATPQQIKWQHGLVYPSAKDKTKIKHPPREALQIPPEWPVAFFFPFLACKLRGLEYFMRLHILYSCISPQAFHKTTTLPRATKAKTTWD